MAVKSAPKDAAAQTDRDAIAIRRLVLCLDGTWNAADGNDITNVVRFRDLIQPKIDSASDAEYQRVYYHTGVGTGLSKTSNIFDGATGRGLGENVRTVYKFLSQHYGAGLEIYIFGFSRGAFTARSLVGYIGASGLLRPENCTSENEERAWRYYSSAPEKRYPSEYEALKRQSFDPRVRIRVLGVFDTVGALGVPVEWFRSWNRKRFQFHDVALSTTVDYAFHAIAIDEKRGPFGASLWQYPNHRYFERAEQVWFPGAHADIGGGYRETGLSSRTLFWMLSRIEKNNLGLKFVDGWRDRVLRGLDIAALPHESRTAMYAWSRRRPMVRVINQAPLNLGRLTRISALPPHAIPLGEMLDYSALHRWSTTPGYRPENLKAALDATFTYKDPRPIPIVDEDGEPLDWVRNTEHRQVLRSFLPDEYEKPMQDTVDWFAARPDIDASVYSTPYEQPTASNW